MELCVLKVAARFAVIELCGGGYYETEEEFEIELNGAYYGKTNKVITTVRNLLPNTVYVCKYCGNGTEGEVSFTTKNEVATLNVRDFGAKGDGVQDDTIFLQTAILACPAGGRVLVPEGVYRVSTVFLKSHICLEFRKGAVLSAFTERECFPVLPGSVPAENEAGELLYGTWEGEREDCFAGILTGIDVEDVTVTGEGIIDGNATWENWWKESKVKRIAWRPRLLYFCRCKDVTVEGITVQNSPSWTVHPYFSEELKFYNMHILNPSYSPNTDRGLRIKTRRGRGQQAVVDDVCFERIVMDGVLTPVVINAFYFCDADGHSEYVQTKTALPVDIRTPRLRHFVFRDINATNCHIAAAYLYGLPEQKIESVRFERFRVSFAQNAKTGMPAMHDDCPEFCRAGIVAKEVKDLIQDRVEIGE